MPICDFGRVPFDDLPHWKQFAVAPPSRETLDVAYGEPAIVSLVNDLAEELQTLNRAFYVARFNHGVDGQALWDGSLNTLAGRNLKGYYRDDAHDDEFLDCATFAATLNLDELRAKPLQEFLRDCDTTLHLLFDSQQLRLGSFNLLQRAALVVRISKDMRPPRETIGRLLRAAEAVGDPGLDPQLVRELQAIREEVRDCFAPLAVLLELRNTAGVAHRQATQEAVGAIAAKFGFANRRWKRRDYLFLLTKVTRSIAAASSLLTV